VLSIAMLISLIVIASGSIRIAEGRRELFDRSSSSDTTRIG